jgi:hypothetical protein
VQVQVCSQRTLVRGVLVRNRVVDTQSRIKYTQLVWDTVNKSLNWCRFLMVKSRNLLVLLRSLVNKNFTMNFSLFRRQSTVGIKLCIFCKRMHDVPYKSACLCTVRLQSQVRHAKLSRDPPYEHATKFVKEKLPWLPNYPSPAACLLSRILKPYTYLPQHQSVCINKS